MKTRDIVREFYSKVAELGLEPNDATCCAPSCCAPNSSSNDDGSPPDFNELIGYTAEQLAAIPEGANLGLGCGTPTSQAQLAPGQTVVDLGSGAGIDAFIAAAEVGPTGRVIGVDMTPTMVSRARKIAKNSDHKNVEFRLGEIEHLPVADSSVDVVISNCVINLSPDKKAVFEDVYRVLKSGGTIAISDIVATAPIPESIRSAAEAIAGCVGNAAHIDEISGMLTSAGFEGVDIALKPESAEMVEAWVSGASRYVASASIRATKPS